MNCEGTAGYIWLKFGWQALVSNLRRFWYLSEVPEWVHFYCCLSLSTTVVGPGTQNDPNVVPGLVFIPSPPNVSLDLIGVNFIATFACAESNVGESRRCTCLTLTVPKFLSLVTRITMCKQLAGQYKLPNPFKRLQRHDARKGIFLPRSSHCKWVSRSKSPLAVLAAGSPDRQFELRQGGSSAQVNI